MLIKGVRVSEKQTTTFAKEKRNIFSKATLCKLVSLSSDIDGCHRENAQGFILADPHSAAL